MAAPQARAHQGDVQAPAPSAGPAYCTPAQLVGSQFVQQYYTVLHSTPRYLHRFYTDVSMMSHNDAEGGQSFTVSSQKEIHEKVMLLDFDEAVTEIWSVDCQNSASSGVIVQVAGSLQCKGKNKRNFVQTFFLAVQEKGYFVLNDIFRYLPELPAQSTPTPADPSATPTQPPVENGYPTPAAPVHQSHAQPSPAVVHAQPPVPAPQPHDVSPTTPAPTPAPMVPRSTPAAEQSAPSAAPQQPMPARSAQPPPTPAPAAPPPEPAAMPTPQQQQEPPKPEPPATEAEPTPEPEPEAQPEPETQQEEAQQEDTWTPAQPEAEPAQEPEAEPAPPAEPAVPLTYAQRLMVNANKASQQASAAATPARAQPKPKPAVPAQAPAHAPPQAPAQQDIPPKAPGPAQPNGLPIANGHAEGYFTRDEGPPGTSIFVRNLPESVTTEKLAEVFGVFGALRGAAPVSLRKQKDKDTFAFVDFQEPAAQQAAIAGAATLDGQQLQVVEKKPHFIRNRGRGGPPPGRGMFRGGRMDGRGYGRDAPGGGRDGGRGRFLERGASLNSVTSDGGRGGRRGRGRDGPAGGSRGDARGGRNGSGAPRPAPRPASTPAAAPAVAAAEA